MVEKAKGVLLLPKDKAPIIDGISSWWVTLHGHANEYIAKAIATQAEQLEQIIFADFTHPQAELLADRLSKLTGLEKLFFSDNGSTAVEPLSEKNNFSRPVNLLSRLANSSA